MSDLRALKDKAAELTSKGKHAAALEAWQAVAAQIPDDVAAQQKVAETLIKLNRKVDAIGIYETVARGYAQKGLFFKASAVCRLILNVDPQHVRTLELISALYSKNKAPVPSSRPMPRPAAPAAPAVVEPEVELDIEVELAPEPPPPAGGPGLPNIPLFSTLSEEELKEVLATAMEVRVFASNDVVLAEGAPGDSMFALVEGTAGVYRAWGTPAQKRVADIAAGQIFGEVALMSGAPRVATVVADLEAVTLEFPREAMRRVVERFPTAGQMLDAFCHERLLANALRASPILQALPANEHRALSASFKPRTYQGGELLVVEGQTPAAVQVLMRGNCTVTHKSGKRYPDLVEGDFIGEVSVLTDGAATATVRASGPVLTLELSAANFKTRVARHPDAMHAVKQVASERMMRTAKLDGEY